MLSKGGVAEVLASN